MDRYQFRRILETFHLSPLERRILSKILYNPYSPKFLKRELQTGPIFYRTINKLKEQGLITIDEKEGAIKLGDPEKIIEWAEKELENTKNMLETQKEALNKLNSYLLNNKNYTSNKNNKKVNKINLQINENACQDGIPIPTKLPDFIKSWLNKNFPFDKWEIQEFEADRIIALSKEAIYFRLNSLTFSYGSNKNIKYGGIYFSHIEQGGTVEKLTPRIHEYFTQGLSFRYKMEKKGYMDKLPNREIKSYEFSTPTTSEDNPELMGGQKTGTTSKYTVDFTPSRIKKVNGHLVTRPLGDEWLVSYWAEDEKNLNEIARILQKF